MHKLFVFLISNFRFEVVLLLVPSLKTKKKITKIPTVSDYHIKPACKKSGGPEDLILITLPWIKLSLTLPL